MIEISLSTNLQSRLLVFGKCKNRFLHVTPSRKRRIGAPEPDCLYQTVTCHHCDWSNDLFRIARERAMLNGDRYESISSQFAVTSVWAYRPDQWRPVTVADRAH